MNCVTSTGSLAPRKPRTSEHVCVSVCACKPVCSVHWYVGMCVYAQMCHQTVEEKSLFTGSSLSRCVCVCVCTHARVCVEAGVGGYVKVPVSMCKSPTRQACTCGKHGLQVWMVTVPVTRCKGVVQNANGDQGSWGRYSTPGRGRLARAQARVDLGAVLGHLACSLSWATPRRTSGVGPWGPLKELLATGREGGRHWSHLVGWPGWGQLSVGILLTLGTGPSVGAGVEGAGWSGARREGWSKGLGLQHLFLED